jgi:hypothetical protein
MAMQRRLQLLLDEPRYRRVAAEARRRKTSVAAVIRDAIDRSLAPDQDAKRAAWEGLMRAEPMPVPETVEELKRELREARSRGL